MKKILFATAFILQCSQRICTNRFKSGTTTHSVYTNGAESRNVAQNGGYAARYKATAGFQKIPENQVLLNEGKVEQNEGYTDASAEYNGWQE